jgi:hypothetical protein
MNNQEVSSMYIIYSHQNLSFFSGISLTERIGTIWRQMKAVTIELNIFETANTSRDAYESATGRITTRVYFTFLALSMGVIVVYTSINLRAQIITVQNPSDATFNMLYKNYRNRLHCPCSQITISYGSFMSISPVFHPVCTSWLVSKEWIAYLTVIRDQNNYMEDDFRRIGPSFFIALASLCELANVTITNAWHVVSHSVLYADEALPLNYFLVHARTIFSEFETTTTEELKNSFATTSLLTQSILITDGGGVT